MEKVRPFTTALYDVLPLLGWKDESLIAQPYHYVTCSVWDSLEMTKADLNQ